MMADVLISPHLINEVLWRIWNRPDQCDMPKIQDGVALVQISTGNQGFSTYVNVTWGKWAFFKTTFVCNSSPSPIRTTLASIAGIVFTSWSCNSEIVSRFIGFKRVLHPVLVLRSVIETMFFTSMLQCIFSSVSHTYFLQDTVSWRRTVCLRLHYLLYTSHIQTFSHI